MTDLFEGINEGTLKRFGVTKIQFLEELDLENKGIETLPARLIVTMSKNNETFVEVFEGDEIIHFISALKMENKELSLAEFITKLATCDNDTSVVFKTHTTPKMNKTGKTESGEKIDNPFLDKDVKKESVIFGVVKFDYASEVNDQRLSENKNADFVSSKRAWGEKSGCFVSHKGELYIDTMVNETASMYIVDGEIIDKSELSSFLPKESENKAQDIEDKIIINTIKLSNIKEVNFNGDNIVYTIK